MRWSGQQVLDDGIGPVLLADGRTRPIAELCVGDAVLGTAPGSGHGAEEGRRYVRTTVLAHRSAAESAHRLTLADGTQIVAGGEHRFLTGRGWRHVGPGWCRSGRRPRIRPGDLLRGPGALPRPRVRTASYEQGYLYGLVRADVAAEPVRGGRIDACFPSERLDLEALGRAHHVLATRAPSAALVAVGADAGSRAPVPRGGVPAIDTAAHRPRDPDDGWCAGFLAGTADAAGTSAGGVLRLATPDEELLGTAAGALHRLGFGFEVEPPSDGSGPRPLRRLRLVGGSRELLRFLEVADPAVSRNRDLAGAAVTTDDGLEVVDVRALGTTVPVFDIATRSGDCVASGVVQRAPSTPSCPSRW